MTSAFSLILQNEYFPQHVRQQITDLSWPLKMEGVSYPRSNEIREMLFSHYLHSASLTIIYQFLYANTIHLKFKYKCIDNMLSNVFTSNESKTQGLQQFRNAQRVYFMFCKLANIYRKKKYPVRNTEDMLMEPILETDKRVFCAIEDGGKYLFTLTDLVNIFSMALLNMEFYAVSPKSVKNPYTNRCFSKSMLINMYFFIRSNVTCVPLLIEKFFRCNFNIRLFLRMNKSWIQDLAIDNYIYSSHYTQLTNGITSMIYDYNFSGPKNRIKIHHTFPEKELCEIMKPYLVLYYKSRYSNDIGLVNHYQFLLKERLKKFTSHNNTFGRMMVDKIDRSRAVLSGGNRNTNHGAFSWGPDLYDRTYLPYKENNHYVNNDLYMVSHISSTDFTHIPDDVNEFSRETIGANPNDENYYEGPDIDGDESDTESDEQEAIDFLYELGARINDEAAQDNLRAERVAANVIRNSTTLAEDLAEEAVGETRSLAMSRASDLPPVPLTTDDDSSTMSIDTNTDTDDNMPPSQDSV